MVLAVIFAQRWKVIDARVPAGPMSATSVVTTNSLCAKGCRPLQEAGSRLGCALRSYPTWPPISGRK